ncbi:MAG TPA: hypothetical protein PKJ05_02205 [Bacillota bacterium]|nr:hypothetical protein [Bacillota bacterium]
MKPLPDRSAIPVRVAEAVSRLRKDGHLAYIVGGAVRDLILEGRTDDWDVATSALPGRVMELFPRNSAMGQRHGSVMAVFDDGTVDITTFRTDGSYSDKRRPDDVSFVGSIEADLARRDFTVNAMAWDPDTGELIDPFGGIGDLKSGCIRTVGDPLERFSEDALRMMRALRFMSVLCFTIRDEVIEAIKQARAGIGKVSAERKSIELGRMIAGKCAGGAIRLFVDTGLAALVLPGLYEEGLKKAAGHIDELPPDPLVRLAALLSCGDPTGPHRVDANIKSRADELKLSRTAKSHMAKLAESLYEGYQLGDGPSIRRWAALLGWGAVEDGIAIRSWYDRNIRNKGDWEADVERIRKVLSEKPPLTFEEMAIKGTDLVKLTGNAGPKVKALLNRLFLDVLDSPDLNTKERLTMLAWVYLKGQDVGGVRQ